MAPKYQLKSSGSAANAFTVMGILSPVHSQLSGLVQEVGFSLGMDVTERKGEVEKCWAFPVRNELWQSSIGDRFRFPICLEIFVHGL